MFERERVSTEVFSDTSVEGLSKKAAEREQILQEKPDPVLAREVAELFYRAASLMEQQKDPNLLTLFELYHRGFEVAWKGTLVASPTKEEQTRLSGCLGHGLVSMTRLAWEQFRRGQEYAGGRSIAKRMVESLTLVCLPVIEGFKSLPSDWQGALVSLRELQREVHQKFE